MQLKGKNIFITGGTGGIGGPLVEGLRAAGAIVHVYDRKKNGDLVPNIDSICARLAEMAPDILINLAGYNVFDHCEKQDIESIVALNLIVPVRLVQAVLPAMKQRGTGHIVNIGSMTALIPLPHLTGYVASKAGLKAFSDSLRRELLDTGIIVTHVTPRAVRTDANKGLKAVLNEKTGVHYDNAEYVAQKIIDAIICDKPDLRIGWPERFFALLQALVPSLIDQGLKKNQRLGEELLKRQISPSHHAPKMEDKIMKKAVLSLLALLLAMPSLAYAQINDVSVPAFVATGAETGETVDPVMQKIVDVQTRWAEIKYKSVDKDKQIAAMAMLEREVATLVTLSPDRPEPKIWDAIVLSSEAGLIKGLSALPKVKKAKALLEVALQQDSRALDGSAYTSLGSLYYQVPGWPIGFGDNEMAEKNLKEALLINPDGIDPNFFYGDFLINQKKYIEAIPVLEKALAAPDRAGRALADEGRRHEIRTALAIAHKNSQSSAAKKNYN